VICCFVARLVKFLINYVVVGPILFVSVSGQRSFSIPVFFYTISFLGVRIPDVPCIQGTSGIRTSGKDVVKKKTGIDK
jgi:hypothetical protein